MLLIIKNTIMIVRHTLRLERWSVTGNAKKNYLHKLSEISFFFKYFSFEIKKWNQTEKKELSQFFLQFQLLSLKTIFLLSQTWGREKMLNCILDSNISPLKDFYFQ